MHKKLTFHVRFRLERYALATPSIVYPSAKPPVSLYSAQGASSYDEVVYYIHRRYAQGITVY